MDPESGIGTETAAEAKHPPTTGEWFGGLPWYKQAFFSIFFFGGFGFFAGQVTTWLLDWQGVK